MLGDCVSLPPEPGKGRVLRALNTCLSSTSASRPVQVQMALVWISSTPPPFYSSWIRFTFPCQQPSNMRAVYAIHASKDKTSPCGESEKVSPSRSGEDTGQNVSCGPFGWSVDEEGTLWGRGLKRGGWPGCGRSEALPSSSICCLPELVRAKEDSGCEGMW